MNEQIATPGLTADWLNAWLAALGITTLVPGIRLSWTDDVIPIAKFEHPDALTIEALASAISEVFPNEAAIGELAIAPSHASSTVPFAHKVTAEAYTARSILDRMGYASLSCVVTDLVAPNSDGSLQTVGSIFDRVAACRSVVVNPIDSIAKTLAGTARRIDKFGLGFDYRRITGPTDPNGGNWIDPVVEVLAFFGLLFFPVRGAGSLDAKSRARTRGWVKSAGKTGAFSWPAWQPSLDAAGLDATLDEFWAGGPSDRPPAWLHTQFESVPYKPLAMADMTRGYGARRKQ
jgi:hypothetical protein